MPVWRVRIAMSADEQSQARLTAALAKLHAWTLLPPPDGAEEVTIELPQDENLGTLLSELHMISPRIYVSSVAEPTPVPVPLPAV
jgi:hypothetical protein